MSEDFEFRAQDSAISLKALCKKFVIFRRSNIECTVDLEPANRCNLFVSASAAQRYVYCRVRTKRYHVFFGPLS